MRLPNGGRGRFAAALTAGALLLAGCGDAALPTPQPRPTAETVPVLTGTQLGTIVDRVVTGVNAADGERDATALAQFSDGPALVQRSAAYTMLERNPQLSPLTPIGTERLQDVVPLEGQWPRALLTVTRRDDADSIPMLLVLTQQAPRDPYKLSAYVPMVSGAALPRTAPIRDGVQTRLLGAGGGLKMSPREAIDLYAAVLGQGAEVPGGDQISPSPLTDAVVRAQDDTRTLLTVTCPECFNVTIDDRATGRLWTFDTLDGGALLIGEISQDTAIVSEQGFVTDLGPEVQAMSGVARITNESTQNRMIMVAINIPSARAESQLTVVGGSSALISASAS